MYTPSPELIAKHKLYLSLLPQAQDLYGFIESHKCDSLLFSGLLGCVPGTKVDLEVAELRPGQWHRRPVWYAECYATGDATSEISRDMLIGTAWNAWCNRRPDIAESVCDYALSHFGVMGKGNLSQTLMTPSLLSTFANISYKLGGKPYPILRRLPCYIDPNLKDYQRHLAVLHTLLRQKMGLKINADVYVKAHNSNPENPLFTYVNGFYATAEVNLRNPYYWPADRLPTSLDRSAPWLLERDYGDDWGPSMDAMQLDFLTEQHSGGDFLFVSALLQGLI